MPTKIFRIACSSILALMLSASIATAQSGSDPCSTGQAASCQTIPFRFGNYDVISSIYVFLTPGTQQPSCQLHVTSIQRRSGLGWLLPSPISLDLLFRSAINIHHQHGDLPCTGEGEEFPLHARLSDTDGLGSVIFDLLSLLHLSDHWAYSIECDAQDIRIMFSECIDGLLFD